MRKEGQMEREKSGLSGSEREMALRWWRSREYLAGHDEKKVREDEKETDRRI